MEQHTKIVKNIAQELGFSFCGVSKAEFLEDEAPKLEEWLKNGFHGKMGYMENHFDKRLDPTLLVPNAKSVVSLAYNYYPKQKNQSENQPKIAKYAYGQDYHFVIKDKLKIFVHQLEEQIGKVEGRVFVDSAPVLERVWAEKSGIGWIGKNSLVLNKSMGSFFFLAEIISDLELIPDAPVRDYCGTCTACIDACPTNAIPAPFTIDSNKCISYLTIELKEEIPKEFESKTENWAFGCDICQDVCPWNRFSKPHNEPKFEPQGWENFTSKEWQEMTQEVFQKVFKKSAVKRTKFEGMKRNLQFIKPTNK